jgi:uncharacterized membrane protein YeiH
MANLDWSVATVHILYPLDLLGVAVAAVSGTLVAGRKKMDLFGIAVAAMITAVGGGTLRDLLLERRPIFWISQPGYLLAALGAALITVLYTRHRLPPRSALLLADALCLAFFTVSGTRLALDAGSSPLIAVLMGGVTGVAGGAMRDVLCAEVPLVFRGEIYATASLAGAILFTMLERLHLPVWFAGGAAVSAISALRIASIFYGLRLPSPILKGEQLSAD